MRNLKRCIWTQSYDRGLEHLLTMWPKVIKAVPDATLDIYYGWQLFDKFYHDNPASMAWKDKMLKLMNQTGVKEHGRIPQPELDEEYKTSGIWAYPTHFGEINCISGLKAQAYGCEPVVINYAALKETVQFGRKVEGDIYDEETQEEYLKQLIDALQNPLSSVERQKMMEWARKYKWPNIAESWDKEFKETV